MTLFLASVGFVSRSPTETWWFPSREQLKSRSSKLRRFDFGPVTSAQTSRYRLGLLAVIVLIVAFISSGVWMTEYCAGSDSAARPLKAAANRLERLFFPLRNMLSMREGDIASDLYKTRPFAYQVDSFAGAKTLLNGDQITMRDLIREPLPALDLVISLRLSPATTFAGLSAGSKKLRTDTVRSRLARITVYWPEEGDFYTQNRKSSTGTRLRDGHCAVDPKVIPYGSVVNVPGVGPLVAVDTGSGVVSKRAARQAGRTREQRSAIVIDVFCSSRSEARALIKRVKHFALVTWTQPQRISEL
jgi:3D (Asp-Asp-Asp) domain-containing protein